jgi:hypothetical protein
LDRLEGLLGNQRADPVHPLAVLSIIEECSGKESPISRQTDEPKRSQLRKTELAEVSPKPQLQPENRERLREDFLPTVAFRSRERIRRMAKVGASEGTPRKPTRLA